MTTLNIDRTPLYDCAEALRTIRQAEGQIERNLERAEERSLAVVVSPRASIDGAKLLAKGWDEKKVADRRLFAGIKPDVRTQIDV